MTISINQAEQGIYQGDRLVFLMEHVATLVPNPGLFFATAHTGCVRLHFGDLSVDADTISDGTAEAMLSELRTKAVAAFGTVRNVEEASQ